MSWAYSYDPHIWPPLITAALTGVLGWYGWQRRGFAGSMPLVFLCLFAFFWAVGSIFETSANDFSTKVFWTNFQGIWQLPVATAMLWSVLELAGLRRWLNRRSLWLLSVPPVITLLLILTNDYHHLIITEFRMAGHVEKVFGIANWIITAYAFVLVLVAGAVLLWLAVRSLHLRRPAIIMLLGMVVAFGFYTLASIETALFEPGERVLLVLGPLSLSYTLAFFRFHVLDPVPLARSALIEQMGDGMLVLDVNGNIVDINPAAEKILGKTRAGLRGRPVSGALPTDSDRIIQPDQEGCISSEISVGSGKTARYYNTNLTWLKDRQGVTLGQLLVLHDTTEQKRAQAQLLERQQAVATLQERERLARELHDGTSQVLGYVNLQSQTIQKWLQSGNVQKAEALAGRLAEIAKDAHADVRESILGLKSDGIEGWAFLPALKRFLSDFQSQYDTRIELSLPGDVHPDVLSTAAGIQVLRVVQEALTNARKHSGARRIRVSLEEHDSRALIRITDDGAGFDAKKQGPDGHFGLAFMQERIAEIKGTLRVDSEPGAGTTVEIEVPAGRVSGEAK